jgi:hypothetical protein
MNNKESSVSEGLAKSRLPLHVKLIAMKGRAEGGPPASSNAETFPGEMLFLGY